MSTFKQKATAAGHRVQETAAKLVHTLKQGASKVAHDLESAGKAHQSPSPSSRHKNGASKRGPRRIADDSSEAVTKP